MRSLTVAAFVLAVASGTLAHPEPEAHVGFSRRELTEADIQLKILSGRAVPPCRKCPHGDGVAYAQTQRALARIDQHIIDEAKKTLSSSSTYEAGFWPQICNYSPINCIT